MNRNENHHIFILGWIKCATITSYYSNANYKELLKCPKNAGLRWKIEDSTGICAQTKNGWVDWEFPDDNAQKSLGFYLDAFDNAGWISPAMNGNDNCGVYTSSNWKDTTSVRAHKSSGSMTVYYLSGTKQLFHALNYNNV